MCPGHAAAAARTGSSSGRLPATSAAADPAGAAAGPRPVSELFRPSAPDSSTEQAGGDADPNGELHHSSTRPPSCRSPAAAANRCDCPTPASSLDAAAGAEAKDAAAGGQPQRWQQHRRRRRSKISCTAQLFGPSSADTESGQCSHRRDNSLHRPSTHGHTSGRWFAGHSAEPAPAVPATLVLPATVSGDRSVHTGASDSRDASSGPGDCCTSSTSGCAYRCSGCSASSSNDNSIGGALLPVPASTTDSDSTVSTCGSTPAAASPPDWYISRRGR